MSGTRQHPLGAGIRFSLFATAYTPLFILIIINQVFDQADKFVWPGWHFGGLLKLGWDYSMSLVLLFLIFAGGAGMWVSLHFMQKFVDGSQAYKVLEVKNKNSETISYIGTYILPFLFEDFDSAQVMISLWILLLLIYFIYINSTAILINPLLNLRYSLYEIIFTGNQTREDGSFIHRTGMLLTKHRHLQEEDWLKMDSLGNQLYFGVEHDPFKEADSGTPRKRPAVNR